MDYNRRARNVRETAAENNTRSPLEISRVKFRLGETSDVRRVSIALPLSLFARSAKRLGCVARISGVYRPFFIPPGASRFIAACIFLAHTANGVSRLLRRGGAGKSNQASSPVNTPPPMAPWPPFAIQKNPMPSWADKSIFHASLRTV